MPRPRRPFLRHERSRHGRWCWYVRKDGKRTRLPDDYGSPEFWSAYDAAVATGTAKTTAPSTKGSLRWLVERYRASAEFLALAESSRYFRGRFLRQAVARSGDVPFAAIARRHIAAAMDARAATPHEANNFLVAMRQLFAWAVDNGHIEESPCEGVKPLKVKIAGHKVWTVELVEQYRAHHAVGTKARLAIDLMLFTGLRRSDLIVVGRQHVKEGVLSIQTQKTKAWVHVPVCAELRASIDAAPSGQLAFLTGRRGMPFSRSRFNVWFRQCCDDAGIPRGYSPHGLRKAGATIAADGGASVHELMAMFGWSRVSMAEVYTREADKRRLARGAAERIAERMTR